MMGKTTRRVEKLVFASAHAIVDPSRGAAVATQEAVQLLAQSGFQCQAFYHAQSEKARARAAQWDPDRLRPPYVEFFRNVHPQPGPPVVRRS
jgi:hypothetical protein